MKNIFFLLALCFFSFTAISNGIQDNQRATPPDVACLDIDIGIVSPAISAQVINVDVDLPYDAMIPVMAVDIGDKCTYVLTEAIIKPPGTLATIQATCNNYNENARDWVTHRYSLSVKTNFLLHNFTRTPTAFD